MKTIILFLMFIGFACYGQAPWSEENIFAATDSIPNITTADTIDWRLVSHDNTPATTWNAITGMTISATNKTSEQTVVISISAETGWGWGEYLEIRIRNTAAIVSPKKKFKIGRTNGAVTLFVTADTTENGANDYVRYVNSDIGGN